MAESEGSDRGESQDQQGSDGSLLGRAFVVLCGVSFLSGFFTAPFASLFPVYVEADLARVPLFTAYLKSVTLVLGGLSAVVGGRLCDLVGLKRTLLVGLVGTVLTGLVFHASGFWILTLLLVAMGVAAGPWSAAGQSYLISSAGPRLGLGGALYFLSMTMGNSLGSLCTAVVKDDYSFQSLGTGMVIGAGLVFALAILLLPASRRAPETASRPGLALWHSYLPLLQRRDVHLLVALRFSITGFWGMASWLMTLLVFRVSGDASTAALFSGVSLAVASCCQLLTGALRDRFGRFWPLLISAAGIVVSALGLGTFSDSLPGIFVFGTALTGTAWAVSTLVPSLIAEIARPEEKSRLVGLGHMVWSAAMVSGYFLGGWLVELDPRLPFYCGALMASVGTCCAYSLCLRLDRGEGQA